MGGLLGFTRVRLLPAVTIVALGSALAATAIAAPLSGRNRNGRDRVVGTAARTINMFEKGTLRLASAPGTTLKEKGTMTGTFKGSLYATFTAFSVSKGSFKVTAYISGGTLTMGGQARDHVAGPTGYAEGTGRVLGGTGRFAHASGNALQYRVIVDRRNYYSTTELHGRLSF